MKLQIVQWHWYSVFRYQQFWLCWAVMMIICAGGELFAQTSRFAIDSGVVRVAQGLVAQTEYYMNRGVFDSAVVFAEQARNYAQKHNRTEEVVHTYRNLGIIARRQGNSSLMFEHFFRGLEIAEQAHNKKLIAQMMSALGSMYIQDRNLERARELLQRAYVLSDEIQDTIVLASIMTEKALLFSHNKQFDSSVTITLRAVGLLEKLNRTQPNIAAADLAHAHISLGWAYLRAKMFDNAKHAFGRALAMYKTIENKRFLPDAFLGTARVYMETQQSDSAQIFAQKALEWAQKLGLKITQVSIYQTLAALSDSTNNFEYAYRYYQQYHKLKDSVFSAESAMRAQVLQKEHEERLHTQEKEMLRNVWIGGTVLLVLIIAILVNRYRLKQHSEQRLLEQQKLLEHQSHEIERVNTQLVAKNHELEQFNQLKNEFLSIAAHDLQSPLSHIALSADLLERYFNDLSAEQRERYTHTIINASEKMATMIRNLLDVNKIETGAMSIELTPLPVTIFQELAEPYSLRAQTKNIQFHVESLVSECPEDAAKVNTVHVLADHSALARVAENILSNALKYTPLGREVRVWVLFCSPNMIAKTLRSAGIRLTHEIPENSVVFAVNNDGAGFTAEDRTRLFTKFGRLSARPTAGESSTGLGLAITKQLVELMHGTIWCESESGEGATFCVALPKVLMPPHVQTINKALAPILQGQELLKILSS